MIERALSFVMIYLIVFFGFWSIGGFQGNIMIFDMWVSLAISIMLWLFIFGLPNEWGSHGVPF